MSKVTKKIANILLHTLAGVVLVAILLILAVAMTLSLPRVQTFVAGVATDWLGKKCDVTISVDALAIENISSIAAEGLYVEDLAGDTLLWVGKLKGKIDRAALLDEGRFVPSDITIENAKLYLSDGTKGSNIDSLVNHIASHFPADTTTSGGTFKIEKIRTKDFRFKLYDDRFAGRVPASSIDYSNMDIQISSATFGDITIEGADVVINNITDLNAIDKSGAALRNSRLGMLRVGVGGLLDFKDVDFRMGGSHLVLPSLVLSGADWKDYSDFCDKVRLTLVTNNTTLEPLSAGKWVHELGFYGISGKQISGTYDGTVNDFVADITGILYDSEVAVKGGVQHITSPAEITADLDLDFSSTPERVAGIYRNILHTPVPDDISLWINKFDTLSLSATAQVAPRVVTTNASLRTNLGGVEVVGTLGYGTLSTSFEGTIRSHSLSLGSLLAEKTLGKVDAQIEGNVAITEGVVEGEARAAIERLGWNGYDFSDINLSATLQAGALGGTISSLDPNAMLYAEGDYLLASQEQEPEYNLNLNVEKIDFGAIGGKEQGKTWLSGNMDANLRGLSLDRMVGRAMINNLVYATAADTLSTELVNLSLSGGERDKSFSLYSPTLDVEYRSTASYTEVINYLTKTIPANLPLGKTDSEQSGDEPAASEALGPRLYAAEDHTAVSVNIKEGEQLAAVLLPGANLAPDSSLSVEFSPSAEEFSLLLESDYMALDDTVISRLRVEGSGVGDNITIEAECDELLAMGSAIPDITLNLGARSGNEIDATLFFSNADAALSGRLAAEATLSRKADNSVRVVAKIEDSYLVSPSERWDISAPKIDYSKQGLQIHDFSATTQSGGLYIDGNISSSDDPVSVTLKDVALGEWMSLLGNIEGVEGVVNGAAQLYAALGRPYGNLSLDLSSLTLGEVSVDPLRLAATKGKRGDNISLELLNTLYDKSLAKGTYNTAKGSYDAKVDVEELDFSLLNPLLKGTAEKIRGIGNIDLNLTGRKNKLDIDGRVSVADFGAKVGFTGAEYTTSKIDVAFKNNRGTIAPIRLEDGEGGWADVEGYIDLENISNVGFGISLVPHNLVAIDLEEESGSPFYGKVYASGGARVASSGGNTEISGAINTGAGSIFNLPLTGNSDFAGADFVTFVDNSEVQAPASSELVARKKSELVRRKKQRIEGNTTIDVMLGVDTDTQLRIIIDPETENVVEARGVADLGITYDERKGDFAIRGDYEISEGVYNFNFQNLITKQFTINPNSYIRWNGSPLDANIDVGATYKLKTSLAPLLGSESAASRASTPVECIVNLTGSLSRVDVSFDINVPNANTEYQSILSSYFSSQEMMATQFVYLLTLGNFYSDSSAGQTNTATAAGTAIGMEFLASQVSRLVSNDAYKFNLKYTAIDDTSSSYSIDFQTEIIDDRLLLELEANVDTGDYYKLGENANQLSGGGAITLLLDKSGDFYLKGFSRTIDRFDENQGLQENGVGLYFKRSFNRLADLWRKKKSTTAVDSEKSDNFVTTEPEVTTESEDTAVTESLSEPEGDTQNENNKEE